MKPIKVIGSLDSFKKNNETSATIDRYEELLEEVFLLRNPRFKFEKDHSVELKKFVADQTKGKKMEECGVWFYFPWNKLLVHYLPDEMHQEVRTGRNKNLVSPEEQNKFYNFKIGIAGLSVGSHAALTINMMGGGRHIKIADPDTISPSNLNRIRFEFTKIGKSKCDTVNELIYQMDPYGSVEVYGKGLSVENLPEFAKGVDVLVDAIDNLELKIRLRLLAKELGIPVLMATDNGDNVIIDVERFDLDKNVELFNGAIGHVTLEEFKNFKPQDMPKLATKIAGAKIVVPRMLGSVLEVGRTLYSWPQLGSAATLAGVATAYAIKRLALGQKVKTGKFEVNLDSIFDPDYHNPESEKQRETERKEYLNKIGL